MTAVGVVGVSVGILLVCRKIEKRYLTGILGDL